MDSVDLLMDRAIRATRDILGRPVAYSIGGIGATVPLRANYVRRHAEITGGLAMPVSSTRDILDFRTEDLRAASITPQQGDTVSFRSGELWEVVDVEPGGVGTTYLHIARRAS